MSETAYEEQFIGDVKPQADYFGFAAEETFNFPDGVSWITFKVMNEGAKAKFQRETQRDLVIERSSGNARTKMDPAAQRHELIRTSVTGWNLTRGGKPFPYNSNRALADFLELADPKVIEDLEKAIRKANPWLLDEMSVADIDREIDSLKEMRGVAEERERGEASSTNR